MALAIEVENVSKLYRLGQVGTGSLSHDLNRWWSKIRGKGDPYERIGVLNDRASKTIAEYVWALKDVNFSVEEGDIVGIVGRNGAGKSTLLKILSKVTAPTKGSIGYNGRIASLLEVGTGFHPELTGIENIFMNGTILGMKQAEIKSKLDEILDFAGVTMYAETPVKRYSTGMIVRLAFAVAAHLETDILIVDEVLAVGDSEFQKKAVGKMEDISRNSGKTVLFVSHNLPTLKSLCKSGILISNGGMKKQGTIEEVMEEYTKLRPSNDLIVNKIKYFQDHVAVHALKVNGNETCCVRIDEKKLIIDMEIEFNREVKFDFDIHLCKSEQPIASYANFVFNKGESFKIGIYNFRYEIELPEVRTGVYGLEICFNEPCISWFAICSEIELEIVNNSHDTFLNQPNVKWGGTLLKGSYDYNFKG